MADARFEFGTKAESLERLAPRLTRGRVPPQIRLTLAEHRSDPQRAARAVASTPWGDGPLVVRSSSRAEDGAIESLAGKFRSVLGVRQATLGAAISEVAASFGENARDDDQIFIQPQIVDVSMAGVAFGRDPNSGGPYLVVNYDDVSGATDSVTAGRSNHLKTYYFYRLAERRPSGVMGEIAALVDELERLTGTDALDIEFAVDQAGTLWLLQARRLSGITHSSVPPSEHREAVAAIGRKIELANRRHPYLHGARTVLGVMPDWNPAEIIGVRPRPLALSLYRELITDSVWAYQRDNYGYKNLRSFPLLLSLHGQPYIDVRVSFNSFVPADIESELAERLVNHYIERLLTRPNLHDKVEFEIIYSCYTLDLPERLAVLEKRGFDAADRQRLTDSLRRLTNRIIHGETGLWRQDLEKIAVLEKRLTPIRDASLDKIARVYWLLEDCKRYGTLPFAGLARAGFIAVQLLRSLVATGVIDEVERERFMIDLDTVSSRMGRDLAELDRDAFLDRYGHLRPGTYDVLSPRYDEEPERYFDWTTPRSHVAEQGHFALRPAQLRRIQSLLAEHGLDHDVLTLIEFIKAGIEGREYAKFIFTRSLSDALSIIKALGREHGLSAEDCAYLDVNDVRALYGESADVGRRLRESAAEGRRRHTLTCAIALPPLIAGPGDVTAFHLPQFQPNYVTQKAVTAPVAFADADRRRIAGAILFIPSADPGYDWIFAQGIAGFVTQYGGVNSHMAIRAGELGVPAAIGVGEALYRSWASARMLALDCANRQVRIVA
jgi:phosphohistidine swiveling domain-containing protein